MIGRDGENDLGITTPKGKTKNWSTIIDSNIFPGVQGGPLMHVIAAKAVGFLEALQPEFKKYSKQVILNAKKLAQSLMEKGYGIVSGGTDTHLVLVDLSDFGITGRDAERNLEKAGITVNKNMVPFDTKSPFVTSGIRIGTPALTTRGMKVGEMEQVADMIDMILKNIDNEDVIKKVSFKAGELSRNFPLYELPD